MLFSRFVCFVRRTNVLTELSLSLFRFTYYIWIKCTKHLNESCMCECVCVCVRATQRKNKNSNWNENVVDSLCSFFFFSSLLCSCYGCVFFSIIVFHFVPVGNTVLKWFSFFSIKIASVCMRKGKKNTILLIQQRIQFSMFFYISCAHTCILSVHQPPALAPIASYRCCFPSVTALDSY